MYLSSCMFRAVTSVSHLSYFLLPVSEPTLLSCITVSTGCLVHLLYKCISSVKRILSSWFSAIFVRHILITMVHLFVSLVLHVPVTYRYVFYYYYVTVLHLSGCSVNSPFSIRVRVRVWYYSIFRDQCMWYRSEIYTQVVACSY